MLFLLIDVDYFLSESAPDIVSGPADSCWVYPIYVSVWSEVQSNESAMRLSDTRI